MKEKAEFIDEMLHAVQTTENEEVSTWFSDTQENHNTTQEQIVNQIFGKIYDTLFSKPIGNIQEDVLANILYTLLEEDDTVNLRTKNQILQSIPETQIILDNKDILSKLVDLSDNQQNTIAGLSVQSELYSALQHSKNSLLEILSDQEIQKHTRFQSVKPKLKGFLSFDEIEAFKSRVLDANTEIDFDKQQIIFQENNICQMYHLWILQKQIKPFVITRSKNEKKQNTIYQYNELLKNTNIEVVDIDEEKITVKTNKISKISHANIKNTIENILATHTELKAIHTNNIQIIEDESLIEKTIQDGFFRFLHDNNIDTTQCSIANFSPAKKTITIGVPSQEKFKSIDDQIYELKTKHPNKRNNFFGQINRIFEYIIMTPQAPTPKGNLGATIKKIIPSKEIIQTIDNSKTFDNAYVLNPTKKEVLIDMIEGTQNHIAIIGEKGTGKTHIAHAIANHIKGHKSVVYTTGKDFYNHYQRLSSSDREYKTKFGKIPQDHQSETFKFKESFKDTNILIVDGVDYVSGTKSATQETIQQIVNKYKLQLIVTSPHELKDVTRTQKTQEDGEIYKQQLELFNVFDNIQSFHLEQTYQTKEQTLNNLRTEFLQSKKGNNLFSATEIPYKAKEMMIHKVNPKRYPSLFIEFYSECARSEEDFLKIIRNESTKTTPEMDEIMTSICNIFFNALDDIITTTQSEDIKWSEQILGRDAQSTKNKILGSTAKNEERKVLAIAVARIKNIHPNSKLSEIAKYLGTKTSSQVKILRELGEDILKKNNKLSIKLGKKISDDFNQKYI